MKTIRNIFLSFALVVGLLFSFVATAQTKSGNSQDPTSSQSSEHPATEPVSGNQKTADDKPAQDNSNSEDKKPERKATPWEILTEGATDHNIIRRQEAIAALGTVGSKPRAIRLVVAALEDRDPSVRQLAARNLGEMHARSAIPKLRQALKDDSAEVCFAAAKSLWDMGDRSGRQVFISILSGEKSDSSGLVKDQLTTAKKKLQDPKQLAVVGAEEAASALFGPAGWGIKIMKEVTKDRSASARAMSASILAHDSNENSLQQLDDALWDKNWLVREAAAQALGASSQRDQISYLRDLLQDDKAAVRYMAAASIIRLSTSKSAHSSPEPAPAPAHAAALRTPLPSK
jgi:HEAT repeat protein